MKIFLFFMVLFCAGFCYSDSLQLDRTEVLPGGEIHVTITHAGAMPEGAWVGIIPSNTPHGDQSVNDQFDVDYQYVNKNTAFTFNAPAKSGAYDFRLSGGGKELASVSFQVLAVDYKVKLTLPKTSFQPGEPVKLSFQVAHPLPKGAWIGIIPSNIPHGDESTNDQHDLTYQYIEDRTEAILEFNVPETGGAYDFRLNDSDSNGKEIGSVSFTVGQIKAEGTLKLSKTSFFPGEEIKVDFTASETLPPTAWVGLIPSKVEHGMEAVNDQYDLQYQYVEKKTTGTMVFVAPPDGGSYDLRMNSSDSNGVEITSVTFQVGGKLDASIMAKMLTEQGKLALYGIQFDFNQATIKAESAQVLSQVAEMLKAQPDLKLSIQGHTDNVGKAAYNLDLSKKRAESVRDYLVRNHGVDAARLSTEGFGDTRPVAKNDTEGGRAQNRRVELVRLLKTP